MVGLNYCEEQIARETFRSGMSSDENRSVEDDSHWRGR
jgi:hypothetical protein